MDRAETFDSYRPLLFSIAYRMLGSAMDAEDMVQETFLRWESVAGVIESPKAYLSAIITRLCIDHLRSAKVQREEYIGPWLPEPIMTETPADSAVLAESLSIAFLVVLERLLPVERAVFLLREVFDYGYAEIARIVNKSEANCRQMVKRAKEHLAAQRPRFEVRREERERLLFQFGQACADGDMQGLLALFSDDIIAYSDGGGKVSSARNPIFGRDRVARFILGVARKRPEGAVLGWSIVNGQPALVTHVGGEPYSVLAFDIAEGRIRRIFSILNPQKLTRIAPQI
jgi:RNA polymerase sigma-70 factor (ECF subfamily)